MSRRRLFYTVVLVLLIVWTLFCVLPFTSGFKLAGSVVYVTFISHFALVLSLIPAWEAAKIEEQQDDSVRS